MFFNFRVHKDQNTWIRLDLYHYNLNLGFPNPFFINYNICLVVEDYCVVKTYFNTYCILYKPSCWLVIFLLKPIFEVFLTEIEVFKLFRCIYNTICRLNIVFFGVHIDKICWVERQKELAQDIIDRGIFQKPLFWIRVLENMYLNWKRQTDFSYDHLTFLCNSGSEKVWAGQALAADVHHWMTTPWNRIEVKSDFKKWQLYSNPLHMDSLNNFKL